MTEATNDGDSLAESIAHYAEHDMVEDIKVRYIKKVLQKYKHPEPPKSQHAPYPILWRKFGNSAQEPEPVDESSKATKEEVLRIQEVVGRILYYARAADLTNLIVTFGWVSK